MGEDGAGEHGPDQGAGEWRVMTNQRLTLNSLDQSGDGINQLRQLKPGQHRLCRIQVKEKFDYKA